MKSRHVAVVLGGTVPHIELVRQLSARSYYVVLADYLQNPPAKKHADEHCQISTLDKEAIYQLAVEKKASLIISTCIDQANASACYVSEKLGLPHPYSYKTAMQVTNKILMKTKMKEGGISTSSFKTFSAEASDFDSFRELQLPLIIKPTDSNSSKGITKIDSLLQCKNAIDTALNASREKQAIVEEYIEGIEVGIDCFVTDNEVHILMVKERRKIPGLNGIQQIYGCYWPMPGYEKYIPKLSVIASQIARTFELTNTPLMIQAIIKGDDVFVLEFAPRIGGGESFRIIQALTGFNFIGAAIDSWEQKKVIVTYNAANQFYAENFIYTEAGVFDKINVSDHAMLHDVIEYFDEYKSSGTMIESEPTSNNRVGVFVVKGNNIDAVKEKTRVALNNIHVLDTQGSNMLLKRIY